METINHRWICKNCGRTEYHGFPNKEWECENCKGEQAVLNEWIYSGV